MLNSKKLLHMAKNWQKLASSRRRRILSRANSNEHPDNHSPSIASRGHLFVYSCDGKRFTIPLTYLSHGLFRDLLSMSEEEFGHPRDGPIVLPCDASCMERVISLLRSRTCTGEEKAMIMPKAGERCTMSYLPRQTHDRQQRFTVYGF